MQILECRYPIYLAKRLVSRFDFDSIIERFIINLPPESSLQQHNSGDKFNLIQIRSQNSTI